MVADTRMRWDKLLCEERLEGNDPDQKARTPFERDVDRIVFSEAFRRLQNKTQVHSLIDNDHVRNRMTHSIEAASLARSMGFLIGEWFLNDGQKSFEDDKGKLKDPSRIAHIVKAATLAHDIGNPPFGHCGESFIQDWFRAQSISANGKRLELTDEQLSDLTRFEGNAQGFRILTKLENHSFNGGLRLTHATLATFTKYPCSALEAEAYSKLKLEETDEKYCGWKKHGFFQSEADSFRRVAEATGLIQPDPSRLRWRRHPLSFIVEAADDIAYRFADLEDGVELGLISIDEAGAFLIRNHLVSDHDVDKAHEHRSARAWLRSIRAKAQHTLLRDTVDEWKRHYDKIMTGELSTPLLSLSKTREASLKALKELTQEKIFRCARQTRHELAGKVAIDGLLRSFALKLCELKSKGFKEDEVSHLTQAFLRMMQRGPFLRDREPIDGCPSPDDDKTTGARVFGFLDDDKTKQDYEAVLRVTDWISGMTDRYCLDTFRTIKGIEL